MIVLDIKAQVVVLSHHMAEYCPVDKCWRNHSHAGASEGDQQLTYPTTTLEILLNPPPGQKTRYTACHTDGCESKFTHWHRRPELKTITGLLSGHCPLICMSKQSQQIFVYETVTATKRFDRFFKKLCNCSWLQNLGWVCLWSIIHRRLVEKYP